MLLVIVRTRARGAADSSGGPSWSAAHTAHTAGWLDLLDERPWERRGWVAQQPNADVCRVGSQCGAGDSGELGAVWG